MAVKYVTISVTTEARGALAAATLRLMAPADRRVTTSEVLITALQIAGEHPQEWLELLQDGAAS